MLKFRLTPAEQKPTFLAPCQQGGPDPPSSEDHPTSIELEGQMRNEAAQSSNETEVAPATAAAAAAPEVAAV